MPEYSTRDAAGMGGCWSGKETNKVWTTVTQGADPLSDSGFRTPCWTHSGSSVSTAMLRLYAQPTVEEEKSKMRGLFEGYVVNPDDGCVIWHQLIVATDEQAARMFVARRAPLGDKENLEDFDIIIRHIGDVRPKAKKE